MQKSLACFILSLCIAVSKLIDCSPGWLSSSTKISSVIFQSSRPNLLYHFGTTHPFAIVHSKTVFTQFICKQDRQSGPKIFAPFENKEKLPDCSASNDNYGVVVKESALGALLAIDADSEALEIPSILANSKKCLDLQLSELETPAIRIMLPNTVQNLAMLAPRLSPIKAFSLMTDYIRQAYLLRKKGFDLICNEGSNCLVFEERIVSLSINVLDVYESFRPAWILTKSMRDLAVLKQELFREAIDDFLSSQMKLEEPFKSSELTLALFAIERIAHNWISRREEAEQLLVKVTNLVRQLTTVSDTEPIKKELRVALDLFSVVSMTRNYRKRGRNLFFENPLMDSSTLVLVRESNPLTLCPDGLMYVFMFIAACLAGFAGYAKYSESQMSF